MWHLFLKLTEVCERLMVIWIQAGTFFKLSCLIILLFHCVDGNFFALLCCHSIRHHWPNSLIFLGVFVSGELFTDRSHFSILWDRRNQSCPLTRSWRGSWPYLRIKTSRGGRRLCQPQVQTMFLRNRQYVCDFIYFFVLVLRRVSVVRLSTL